MSEPKADKLRMDLSNQIDQSRKVKKLEAQNSQLRAENEKLRKMCMDVYSGHLYHIMIELVKYSKIVLEHQQWDGFGHEVWTQAVKESEEWIDCMPKPRCQPDHIANTSKNAEESEEL